MTRFGWLVLSPLGITKRHTIGIVAVLSKAWITVVSFGRTVSAVKTVSWMRGWRLGLGIVGSSVFGRRVWMHEGNARLVAWRVRVLLVLVLRMSGQRGTSKIWTDEWIGCCGCRHVVMHCRVWRAEHQIGLCGRINPFKTLLRKRSFMLALMGNEIKQVSLGVAVQFKDTFFE